MNRQNLRKPDYQLKKHYKMYKAGKQWLFAGISLLTLGTGLVFSSPTVQGGQL